MVEMSAWPSWHEMRPMSRPSLRSSDAWVWRSPWACTRLAMLDARASVGSRRRMLAVVIVPPVGVQKMGERGVTKGSDARARSQWFACSIPPWSMPTVRDLPPLPLSMRIAPDRASTSLGWSERASLTRRSLR